jgi:hypothetical protein
MTKRTLGKLPANAIGMPEPPVSKPFGEAR